MTNTKEVFKSLLALIDNCETSKALDMINNNFDIFFAQDPLMLLNAHIEALIDAKMLLEAKDILVKYHGLPYVSFTFEQVIKTYEKRVNALLEAMLKPKTILNNSIIEKLKSKHDSNILMAIKQINEESDFKLYMSDINDVLSDESVSPISKTFIIGYLQKCQVTEKITMNKFNERYECIPSDLPPFGEDYTIDAVVDKTITIKNISIIMMTKELLRTYGLVIYPISILDDEHRKNVCIVSGYIITCGMFNEPPTLKEKLMIEYKISEEEIIAMCQSIKLRALNNNL